MINVSGAVRFFSKPIKVDRKVGEDGFAPNGDSVKASRSSVTVKGSIQPVRGSDLKDMPEGVREEASYIVSSTTALQHDDYVHHLGQIWRVVHNSVATSGSYHRSFLGLLKDD